jgi:hypothetical protein
MAIDYEQLKSLVKEAMFTGGGINVASAPEGIPHRMPAANPPQETGTPEANALYDLALVAREATEKLVAALDDPTYDDAYENAFRASASLRKALNNLIEDGAHPTPEQRVVAPPKWEQPFNAGGGDYGGGAGYIGGAGAHQRGGLEEALGDPEGDAGEQLKSLGVGRTTGATFGSELAKQGADIKSGKALGDTEPEELKMIQQINSIVTKVAEAGGVDLLVFKSDTKAFLQRLLKKAEEIEKRSTASGSTEKET